MWTVINQTYATSGSKNAWAHLKKNNTGWRRIKPSSSDGVTNVFLMLVAAKASGKQAHVVQDGDKITKAYF
ncbi:hypothetical protein [Isoptericola sp. AK164]|uniref:hypothetical protein n=1 Tax=Isoptericola sp. AK164 TaxID=3024246 RepID=UPI002418B39C|nr:hypothetical protein [Isoptericola sp. AK164]